MPVAAPTGLAAFNVDGTTIHRLFQLPVEHEVKSAMYWSLSKMLALAHMLLTAIYSYNTDDHKWHKYGIADVDRNESDDVTRISICMHHPDNHFEVVQSIRP